MERSAYLDHNATTAVVPAAAEAAAAALALIGNASSAHGAGRATRKAVEEAREKVAALVGAAPAQVVFTSSGSEANNMALRGCGRPAVAVSAVEHPSVLKVARDAALVPVDANGVIDTGALDRIMASQSTPAVVSVMLANNETGVIQPVAEVADIARRHGALIHCDAVQAAGRIPVDVDALGVHMLSLSAHKMGGPPGVGALVAADDVTLAPAILGGGQEKGLRAGTENIPGIAGFGAAADAAGEMLATFARLAGLRDRLEERVRTIARGTTVFGAGAERLPNTSCFTLPGVSGQTQVMALDLAGVAVSAGSACGSGNVAASHVLAAMGVAAEVASTAIRVSLGWPSTDDDVETFVAAWGALAERAGADAAAA